MGQVPIGVVFNKIHSFLEGKDAPVRQLMRARGSDPFHILVSTLLSSRTNDKTTIPITARIVKTVKTPADLDKLSLAQVERLIFPVSFYKTKARHLKLLPAALAPYGGMVPDSIERLITLPGVGRKTANIVLVEAFGKDALSVDIHVHRITNRLGIVKTKKPFQTEMALRKKVPKRLWKEFNPTLVAFGQLHCTPVNPKCGTCPVRRYCRRVGVP